MICGTTVGSKYGPDGMLRRDPDKSSANPEFSDGNQTDATSAGNTDGRCEVDFSSSDAESADAATALAAVAATSAAAAPTAAAELPPKALVAAAAFVAGAPATIPVSTAAPVAAEPVAANAVQNLMDLDLVEAPAPAGALPSRPTVEAAPADDWLGEAIGGSTSSSSPATSGNPERSRNAAATSHPESGAAPPTDSRTKAVPEDLFAACSSAPVEAKLTRSEELFVTPKAHVALVPEPEPEVKLGDRLLQQQQQQQQQQQDVPAAAAGTATGVPDRFAALGELAEPVGRLPQGQLTPSSFKPSGACSGASATSPAHGRGTADTTSPAFMSPQRLDEMPAEHLADLHAMVTRALQQRTQAGIGSSPVQPVGWCTPAAQQVPRVQDLRHHAAREELPFQPPQFGDVLAAFHEKNPSWEDKHSSTAPKAMDSSGSSDREQPKDFDDLLAAFHKRNPIVGFNSPA